MPNSCGVAAFPNNEAFRLGTTEPAFFVPRVFVRQTIGLSGDTVPTDGDPLRSGGPVSVFALRPRTAFRWGSSDLPRAAGVPGAPTRRAVPAG